MHNFRRGDRVEYSEKGKRQLNPQDPTKVGYVTGMSKLLDCVGVRWDGNEYSHRINVDFLKKVED